MATLTVVDPGLFCTVQDGGRAGWSWAGVPVGGAADPLSIRIGNAMVGNPPGSSAIETTLNGGAFAFDSTRAVAVTGAVSEVSVTGSDGTTCAMAMFQPAFLEPGSTIRVGRALRGCRAYVCVGGGLAVPRVMGSSSTHAGARFGGHEGRPLRAGDRIGLCGDESGSCIDPARGVEGLVHEAILRRMVRVVLAPAEDGFDLDGFVAPRRWVVSARSDRMGIRLSGEVLAAPFEGRMPSQGMMWGAVQVPPGGEPIVLLCDHPTTGGYPVIGCVIAADLPAIGQWRPGDAVGFVSISVDQARRALREQSRRLFPAAGEGHAPPCGGDVEP